MVPGAAVRVVSGVVHVPSGVVSVRVPAGS